jgi:glycosyltransferase involved in cell wall biosynthesis
LYVHDYWPKHQHLLGSLVARYRCGLLASTEFIRDTMRADGLEVELAPVGVPLGNLALGTVDRGDGRAEKVVGSAGRLVPRKRFGDVVAAFGSSGVADRASLHLRLVASCVYGVEQDERLMTDIREESDRSRLGTSIRIDTTPSDRSDYRGYDLYVCASSYEGFSMTPIEAAYSGCPPLMSDIPAHQAIATTLFPGRASDFLFPVGDVQALARVMTDEIETGRRASLLRSRLGHVRTTVETRWSPRVTAEALVDLVHERPARRISPRTKRRPSEVVPGIAGVAVGHPS